jgi:hypothetical protein
MQRLLAIIALMAISVGCQAENPFAFFGPARVPAPGAQSQAPYYPPTGSASTQPIGSTAVPAASPLARSSSAATVRPSVSADNTMSVSSGSSFVTDAGDREPIRIVENPSPAARTATAPAFGNGSAPPGATPSTISPPPQNNNRGYTTPSTSGKMSGNSGRDSSVAPASYEQSLAPQMGGPSGQWRAR